jgi:membrane protein DedA with SNARE-associated domain
MFGTSFLASLSLAGKGPLLQAVLIILGTFVLEDATTVLAAMRVQEGGVDLTVALLALYAGIVLGDLGLYGLGRLSARVRLIARWVPPERSQAAAQWLDGRLVRVVLISRFIPGMRLPTYTACGYLRADLRRFTLAAVVATLAWTSLLFAVSLQVGKFMIEHLGEWRWAGAIGFALTVVLLARFAARSSQGALKGIAP